MMKVVAIDTFSHEEEVEWLRELLSERRVGSAFIHLCEEKWRARVMGMKNSSGRKKATSEVAKRVHCSAR